VLVEVVALVLALLPAEVLSVEELSIESLNSLANEPDVFELLPMLVVGNPALRVCR
jgi:hypothetical protein